MAISDPDQAALAAWLDSRRASSLENESEDSLLRSLDTACQEIEAGRGHDRRVAQASRFEQ